MSLSLKKQNRASGFTLIELLVVIAIIGILASVVLSSLSSARVKSRDARRLSDIKQIQLALELYFDANGNLYPPSTGTITTNCDMASPGVSDGLEQLVIKGYIPQVPRDPNSTTAAPVCYYYGTPAPSTVYHLGAKLEDVSNAAFNGDKDCDSTTANKCYTAADDKGGFDGTADATNRIYDVTP